MFDFCYSECLLWGLNYHGNSALHLKVETALLPFSVCYD